jgi:hypothetical protein
MKKDPKDGSSLFTDSRNLPTRKTYEDIVDFLSPFSSRYRLCFFSAGLMSSAPIFLFQSTSNLFLDIYFILEAAREKESSHPLKDSWEVISLKSISVVRGMGFEPTNTFVTGP